MSRAGDDAPLGEKAFSSDPKRVPWGTAPPSRRPSSARYFGQLSGAPSAPRGEGPRAMLSRPTAARASPHRVGGGSRTGPGPAFTARWRPASRGRVRRFSPRGEVWGSGRLRLRRPPLLRFERLSARSRPEPRPVGAARARVGPPRSGGSFPGVWVFRAATGRLEREKTGALAGFPSAARSSRGGSRRGGAGQWSGPREGGGRGRSASRASRGRPRVWRWDPRAFSRWPGCVFGPFPWSSAARLRPFHVGSRLARGLLPRRRRFAPSLLPSGSYRGRSLAARVSPPPPRRGGRRLPRRGAPLGPGDAVWGTRV